MIEHITTLHIVLALLAIFTFVLWSVVKFFNDVLKKIVQDLTKGQTEMVQNSINLGAFIMMDSIVETHLKNGDAVVNGNGQVRIGDYVFIKYKMTSQEYWTNIEMLQDFQKKSVERIEKINLEYAKAIQQASK